MENIKERIRNEGGIYTLVVLRIMIAFMLLWAFCDKLLGLGLQTPAGEGVIDGGSPSSFLGFFEGGTFFALFEPLMGNVVADVLLMAGLLLIGIGLLLGIASKLTTVFGMIFMFTMYLLCFPPHDNPLIEYHLIYIVAILLIYFYKAGDKFGLGIWWKEQKIVQRFPILE